MLYLDPAWVTEVLSGNARRLDTYAFVSASPMAYRAFCRLNTLLFSCESTKTKEAGLVEFLTENHWCSGTAIPLPQPSRARLEAIQIHLLNTLGRSPNLAALARDHGMSRYQLIRLFRRETGLSPHAWLLDQRIQQARRRLQQGADLAYLAQELGFADQCHFQRAFKARVASTPGRYRYG